MKHPTDQLSAYLDGDLSFEEEERLEEHLESCPECAAVLEELAEVIRRAGALEDHPPARDLWPTIDARLPDRDPRVIDLARRRRLASVSELDEGRGVRMSVPRLVAAAAALVLASGAGAWVLRGQLQSAPIPTNGPPSLFVPAARADMPERFESYVTEVRNLQTILSDYRDQLKPATVRVLERSLVVIDRAIEESKEALEADPGNEYLADHLEATLRRKVEFLREATATLRSAT